MATILEALQNANFNIKNNVSVGLRIAKDQLNNAVVLLEKGYDLHDDVEELMEPYDFVDQVPDNSD